MPPTPPHPAVTAVVPLKAIPAAKTRMAPALSAAQRRLLLHRTFGRVVDALLAAVAVTDVLVVVGDAEGASWAAAHGLATEPDGGGGLNAALAAADRRLGTAASLVVPADLQVDHVGAVLLQPRRNLVHPVAFPAWACILAAGHFIANPPRP